MGHTWSDTTGFSFTNGGLIDLKNLSFNTVDGFVYGIDFRINKRFKDKRSLAFYPDIRYAFSRERIMWRVKCQLFDRRNEAKTIQYPNRNDKQGYWNRRRNKSAYKQYHFPASWKRIT